MARMMLVVFILIYGFLILQYRNAEKVRGNLMTIIQEDTNEIDDRVIRVNQFKVVEATGITYDVGDGDAHIELPGIYFVSCQLLVEMMTAQQLKLEINIDDEDESTFQSSITDEAGNVTIAVNGIFKTNVNSILNIILRTEAKVIIMKNSRFSLTLLSNTDLLQGFSVHLARLVWRYKMNRLRAIRFKLWSSERTVGSFINTNLFVVPNGYLVISADSVYLFAINIVIVSAEQKQCKHSVMIKSNDNRVVRVQNGMASPKQWITISLVHFVRLDRNDRVWIEILSTCDKVRLRPESTFSVSQLPPPRGHGMSLTSFKSISIRGWFAPDLTIFKSSSEPKYHNSNLVISPTYLKVKSSGMAILAINLEIGVPDIIHSYHIDITSVLLVVSKNQILDSKENIYEFSDKEYLFWVQSSSNVSVQASLSLVAKFAVKTFDVIRMYVYIPTGRKLLLLKNSTISMNIMPVREADNSSNNIQIQSSSDWQLLQCMDFNSEYLKQLDNNLMRVVENGIYFVAVNIEAGDADEYEDFELALAYHIKNTQRTLLYTRENEVNLKKTFKLASTLILHSIDSFGLYIRTSNKRSSQVNCTIQLHFIGDQYSILGFQANFKTNFTVVANSGYFSLTNFQNFQKNSALESLYYNTGDAFSFSDGIFKAPLRGIYLLSVNLVVKNVIMTSDENYVALTVKVNGKDSAFFTLKQHNLMDRRGSGVRNSAVSFCLSGSIQLNDHDQMELQVFVRNDNRWWIDSRSSFSVVLLSRQPNGFLVYRPIRKLSSTNSGDEGKIISGWETTTASAPYGMFTGTTRVSPVLRGKKNIAFAENGVYIVSMNILMNSTREKKIPINLVKEITIKLVKQNTVGEGEVEIPCDRFKITYQVVSASCQIVSRFRKDEEYSIQIYSTSNIDAKDFYEDEELANEQNMAYLSVILLGHSLNFQAGLMNLKKNLEYSLGSGIIKPWRLGNMVNRIGNRGFHPTTGEIHIRSKGWFFFASTVQCERGFGNGTVDLVRQGDEPGKVLLKATGACNVQHQTLSFVGVEYLDRDEVINCQLSGYGGGSIIAKYTQLSFSYIRWPTERFYINSRITYSGKSNKRSFVQPITWSANKDDALATVRNLPFDAIGVYLLTVNLIAVTVSPSIKLKVRINNSLKTKDSLLFNEDTFIIAQTLNSGSGERKITMTLAAAVILRRSKREVKVLIQSTAETFVEPLSTVSVTFIRPDYLEWPVLLLRVIKRVHQLGLNWRHFHHFNPEAMSKFYFENKQTIIPAYSGIYMFSCHIILSIPCPPETVRRGNVCLGNVRDSPKKSNNYLTLGLWLDSELVSNTTDYIGQTNTQTMSITQTMFLRQGSRINLMILTHSKLAYWVEAGSTLSVVLLESPQGVGKDPMLPVITRELISSNIIIPNSDEELYCDTIGPDKHDFLWYFNNTKLKNEVYESLHPKKYQYLGSGRFQCQAILNGVGPLSRSAFVRIKPVNECKEKEKYCPGGNDTTCTDKLVGFSCGCMNIAYNYLKGKCVLKEKPEGSSESDELPLVVFILIPFVCLTILIVLACSIYVCIKRRQAWKRDPERIAVVDAENPDDITMQSLNNSLAEDYSDDNATLDRTNRRISSSIDDSVVALIVRSDTKSNRAKRDHNSTRSYEPAVIRGRRHHNEDGFEGHDQHSDRNWLKLMDNTSV